MTLINTTKNFLSVMFSISCPQTTFFERVVYYSVIKLFNILPENIENKGSIESFKGLRRCYLDENAFYTLMNTEPYLYPYPMHTEHVFFFRWKS